LVRYIPVIEKITTHDGKNKTVSWKGRVLNKPGYKITDSSREAVEKRLHAHIKNPEQNTEE
jgi:hypothetical protein